MFKFLKERKAQKRANQHRRGWDFAAGRILEDGPEVAIPVLKANLEESRVFGSYNSFDEGIEAAISKTEGRNYFTASGTLLNPNGSRSIFDDLDK